MYLTAKDHTTSDRLAFYVTEGQHHGSWEVTVTNDPKYFATEAPVVTIETGTCTVYVAVRRTYLMPDEIKHRMPAINFSLETKWANLAIFGPDKILID